jgi:hypothetical protein
MSRFTLALALVTTTLVGCKQQTGDLDSLDAELAVDSTNVSQGESEILSSAVDGSEAATGVTAAPLATPQGTADWIAAHAAAKFSPAGCATVTESGLTDTITFADCTGPRGLLHLTGSIAITVSAGASGAIDLSASATDLEVNNATISIDSTAVYTVSGTSKSLAVTTQGSGTGPLGNTIQHDGQYTASWDATCGSIEGSWSTEVGAAQRSTTANVMKCANQCPTGTITRDTFRGHTITVTFDGTAVAKWTTSTGGSGTVDLTCGQ